MTNWFLMLSHLILVLYLGLDAVRSTGYLSSCNNNNNTIDICKLLGHEIKSELNINICCHESGAGESHQHKGSPRI